MVGALILSGCLIHTLKHAEVRFILPSIGSGVQIARSAELSVEWILACH